MYEEEDFLQLSGIQHFAFCRRQWALAYIEMQWNENALTAEGRLIHEKAHDASSREKRQDVLISRGMPVHSRELGVSGECDVVEFHRAKEGISLTGYTGMYTVIPIEYKRGEKKADDIDTLQLTAQAMCLEEMLCSTITTGYLYYGKERHRTKVEFTPELRQKVTEMFLEMHKYEEREYTPRVKPAAKCKSCSLYDICLPKVGENKSVKQYMDEHFAEKEEQ